MPKGKLASLVEKLRPDAPTRDDPEAKAAAVDATRAAQRTVEAIQQKIAAKSSERATLDDRIGDLALCVELGLDGTSAELAESKRDLAKLDDTLSDLAKGLIKATDRVIACEAEQRRLAFAGEAKTLQKQCRHIGEHLDGAEKAIADLVKHFGAALDWSERMRMSWPRDYRMLNDGLLNLHAALASEMDRQSVNHGVRALPGAAREYLGAKYNADPQSFPSLTARWEGASAHLLRMLTGEPMPASAPVIEAPSPAAQAPKPAPCARCCAAHGRARPRRDGRRGQCVSESPGRKRLAC